MCELVNTKEKSGDWSCGASVFVASRVKDDIEYSDLPVRSLSHGHECFRGNSATGFQCLETFQSQLWVPLVVA